MTWDPAAWFIGGGAEVSEEMARTMLYAATGGAEGIVNPADLKVTALSTPGASVQALPGAALAVSREAGGAQQSYAARNPTADVVPVSATSSAGGRADMVVAMIEDPFVGGDSYTEPADPTQGRYVYTRVIPNVPATARRVRDVPALAGKTAIALARINIPASTATITNAMITDLREVAVPRTDRSLLVAVGTGGDLTSSTEGVWPTNAFNIPVPIWATRLRGVVTMQGLVQTGGNVSTEHRIRIGSSGNYVTGAVAVFDNDTANTTAERQSLSIPIDVAIPASKRGIDQAIAILSKRTSTGAGKLTARGGTSITFDLYFTEDPT